MADKQVRFDIILGGIPALKNSMKGISEAARAMNLSVQQTSERSSQRIVEIERNKAAAIKRINDNSLLDEKNKAKRIADIEANTARQSLAVKERQQLRIKQMNEKFALNQQQTGNGNLSLGQVSKLARLTGFNRIGSVIDLPGQLGIGSDVSSAGGAAGGAEGAAGAAGLAEVAAVAGPLAIALGALVVTSKVLELGFKSASTQVQYVAENFLGAAAQIGGAKNLQELIVSASERENSIKSARFVVAPNERLSEAELQGRAAAISTREDLGAPAIADVIEAQKNLGTLTGKQRSLDQGELEFIAKGAHVGRISMAEMANVYGQVRAQNKNASGQDVQNMFLAGMAIGQHGAFSIENIPQARGLIQASGMLAGDGLTNTKNALAIGTILKPRTGDLESAGTQYQAFIQAASKAYRGGQLSQEQKAFFNKNGQITDINGLVASVSSQTLLQRARPFSQRVESSNFLANVRKASGVNDDDSKDTVAKKIRDTLGEFEGFNMTMKQLNQENTQSISAQDQLRAKFNELEVNLGGALLPVLKDLTPYVQAFVDVLVQNKDSLGEASRDLLQVFLDIIPAFALMARAALLLGEVFGKVTGYLATSIDSATGGMFHKDLEPFEKAGDQMADADKKLDDVIAKFGNLATAIDNITKLAEQKKKDQAEDDASSDLTGWTPSAGPAPHEHIVDAINNLGHSIRHGNINKEPSW